MLDYTVKIYGIGYDNEVEWEETVTSRTSMTGARRKAMNWIKKNLCESDYSKIDRQRSEVREYWYVS